jgi:hypothetical protein
LSAFKGADEGFGIEGLVGPFDPKPLIRTFESAQRRLSELSGDLELRENELSAAVRI